MRDLEPEDLEAVAVHEAGHAVVAWRLDVEIIRASTIRRGDSLGRVEHGLDNVRLPTDERRFTPGIDPEHVRGDALRSLALSVAGREAHAYLVLIGRSTEALGSMPGLTRDERDDNLNSIIRDAGDVWGDGFDREQQSEVLASFEPDDFGFGPHSESIGYLRHQSLVKSRHRAREIVHQDWALVTRLANELVARRELSGEEVYDVLTAAQR